MVAKVAAAPVQKPVPSARASPKAKSQAKANHLVHVPSAKKCEPPAQSLFARKDCTPVAPKVVHVDSVAVPEELG